MIAPGLAQFLEEGLSIHVGTRNDRLEPNGVRAAAVRVDPAGTHVEVYVAEAAAARVLRDLEANGQIAISLCRPVDDKACQVKGRFVSVRPAEADDRAVVTAQWDRFVGGLELIGIPRAATARWPTWPAVAIRLAVTALFEQTPAAGTGGPLA
ncbi:MAG: hypothetical protein AB7H88_18145 [Vicinamibacterales bacterium]